MDRPDTGLSEGDYQTPLSRWLESTRIGIDRDSTTGVILEESPHWSIEPFLGVEPRQLFDAMQKHHGEMNVSGNAAELSQISGFQPILEREWSEIWERVEASVYKRHSEWMKKHYSLLDSETLMRVDPDLPKVDAKIDESADHFDTLPSQKDRDAAQDGNTDGQIRGEHDRIEWLASLAKRAGYTPLERDAVAACVGVASRFGVPVRLDLDMFEQLRVFSRGDVMGVRVHRRLRKLYRRETIEIPVYRHLLVAFQFGE
ncbi:MAG: hypothetical protein AAF664_09955, partial [Planctomycetota bacterium]